MLIIDLLLKNSSSFYQEIETLNFNWMVKVDRDVLYINI